MSELGSSHCPTSAYTVFTIRCIEHCQDFGKDAGCTGYPACPVAKPEESGDSEGNNAVVPRRLVMRPREWTALPVGLPYCIRSAPQKT